jgi:cytochrome c-type biogenesis protein CcmE
MATGRKLAIAGLVVAGVTGYMAYLGASSSWQYYVTVDECLTGGDRLARGRIRVSGRIAPHSLVVAEDGRSARFALRGAAGSLPVTCSGPLPDNLAENTEAVVEGRLDETGILCGEKLLTRCASKYQSQVGAQASADNVPSGREARR